MAKRARIWTGTEYIDVFGATGPMGPTGPAGAAGAPGAISVETSFSEPATSVLGHVWIRTNIPPQVSVLATEQMEDSPLALWAMTDTSGTQMSDHSGNDRHGTYTNMTLNATALAGMGPRAVTFNGTSAKVTVPYASWMDVANFTIEWLCTVTEYKVVQAFPERYGVWVSDMNWGNSRGLLWWNNGGGVDVVPGGVDLTPLTGALLAMRFDGSTLKWFKNGTEVFSGSAVGTLASAAVDLVFGYSTHNGEWLAGSASHLAFYGTALSPTRLLAHAQAAGLA